MKKISKAAILSIGDEILIGQILDTNANKIAKWLVEKGISIERKVAVGDDEEVIKESLEDLAEICDLILVTGGLGPTKDDKTKQVISDLFGSPIVKHEPTMVRLEKYLKLRNRVPTDTILQQAYYPDKAIILPNDIGTAQGILMVEKDALYLFMPGVPHEMEFIFKNSFLPWLAENKYETGELYHQTMLTAGIGESTIAQRIEDIENTLPSHIKLSYLPQLGGVRIRLTAFKRNVDNENEMKAIMDRIAEHVQGHIMSRSDTTKIEALHDLLIEKGLTIGCAESCSGGLLTHKLTTLSGSSAYLLGAVVAYSDDVKEQVLGVSTETLEREGAVSEATVVEMNAGLIKLIGCDIAVSVSGIAGPTGGTIEKPVGTIWIAVGNEKTTRTRLLDFNRNRAVNVEYATEIAIFEVFRFIQEEYL